MRDGDRQHVDKTFLYGTNHIAGYTVASLSSMIHVGAVKEDGLHAVGCKSNPMMSTVVK